MRTAIFVYGRTTLAIECDAPLVLSAFGAATPGMHLEPGAHAIPVEPGVYLAHGGAGVTAGGDIDVVAVIDGKPARRTPRRLSRALPAIDRRELARFFRRPAAPPPRPQREIRRILAVDDDPAATRRYAEGFGPERTVVAATGAAEARALVEAAPFDLAIVELRIGRASGIELARELKRAQPSLVVALCSGYLSVEVAVTAVRAGIDVVLFKPATAAEILWRIDRDPADEPAPEETPTLERAEWEHIARVLADCRGNISLAAHRLGIYRSSLQRRLRRAGATAFAYLLRAPSASASPSPSPEGA